MPRILGRFIFMFSTTTAVLMTAALAANMFAEVSLSDPTMSPAYLTVIAFCFAALVTAGTPKE